MPKLLTPAYKIFQLSVTTGEGMDAWYDWLKQQMEQDTLQQTINQHQEQHPEQITDTHGENT